MTSCLKGVDELDFAIYELPVDGIRGHLERVHACLCVCVCESYICVWDEKGYVCV